jgi:ribosomal protein S18 acetylase RimI-like enzyme
MRPARGGGGVSGARTAVPPRPGGSARVRPLEAADLPDVARVGAAAFGFEIADAAAGERWRARIEHPFLTDPDGGVVAVADGRVVGAAHALVRERLWVLSLLVVDPSTQSAGAGRDLLAAALRYGAAQTDCGIVISSNDARALRLYARAGFALLPSFEAAGTVDRRVLPSRAAAVREGGDLEDLAATSREIRGAPHTLELEYALGRGGVLLSVPGRGFSVAMPGHAVWLLAARDADTARTLLWAALEAAGGDGERPLLRWITGAQQWALEVAVQAGLGLRAYGAIGVRGNPGPLAPYLPSPPFA